MRIRRPSKSLDYGRRTALYRLFDGDGRLLYVGIAFEPRARWSDHSRQKDWWPAVVDRHVEWDDSRRVAAVAEVAAIRDEKPLHNIRDSVAQVSKRATHAVDAKVGRMVRISDDTWDLYGDLCAEDGTSRADDLRRHVYARVAAWRKAQGIDAPKRKVTVRRKKPAADSD